MTYNIMSIFITNIVTFSRLLSYIKSMCVPMLFRGKSNIFRGPLYMQQPNHLLNME